MKLIFKNFNNYIKKTVAKLNDKTNSFYKKIKVVKYFDIRHCFFLYDHLKYSTCNLLYLLNLYCELQKL